MSLHHPERDFGDFIRAQGLDLEGDPQMDGRIHRLPAIKGKPSNKAGAYKGYLDGRPNGWVRNFLDGGEIVKWRAERAERLPPEQQAQRNAELKAKMARQAAEKQRQFELAAQRNERRWNSLASTPGNDGQTYLDRKQVPALGVRFDGNDVVVPVRDIDGKLWSLQTIPPEPGKHKLFEAGGRTGGKMHVIGALEDGKPILVAEGYATGASLAMAAEQKASVAVAFYAGNIEAVVGQLKARYPNSPLAIMADDDRHREDGTNPGLEKARDAGEKHGVVVVPPRFKTDEKGATDFNDLHVREGLDAVRQHVDRAIAQAAAGRTAAPMPDQPVRQEPPPQKDIAMTEEAKAVEPPLPLTDKIQYSAHRNAEGQFASFSVKLYEGKELVGEAKNIDREKLQELIGSENAATIDVRLAQVEADKRRVQGTLKGNDLKQGPASKQEAASEENSIEHDARQIITPEEIKQRVAEIRHAERTKADHDEAQERAAASLRAEQSAAELEEIQERVAERRRGEQAKVALRTQQLNTQAQQQAGAQAGANADAESQQAPADEAGKRDKATAVPEHVEERYVRVDNRFYRQDDLQKPAFEDKGEKLTTKSNGKQIINDLLDIAEARGWQSVRVGGKEEFRRQAWLEASLRGMEARGFEPKDQDRAMLAKLRAERDSEPVNSIEAMAAMRARVDASMAGLQAHAEAKASTATTPQKSWAGTSTSGNAGGAMTQAAEPDEFVTLVKHGAAPYQFNEKNEANYYAMAEDSKGKTRTMWGVDLERAINESGAQLGDKVKFQNLGRQPVTIEVPIKDAQGNITGYEEKEAWRNIWQVTPKTPRAEAEAKQAAAQQPGTAPGEAAAAGQAAATASTPQTEGDKRAAVFLSKPPADAVKEHPELVHAYATLDLTQKFARDHFPNPRTREQFVETVRQQLVSDMREGKPIPAPMVKEAAPEQEKTRQKSATLAR